MYRLSLADHLQTVGKPEEFKRLRPPSYIFGIESPLLEAQNRFNFVTYWCFTKREYVMEFDTETDMIIFAMHT